MQDMASFDVKWDHGEWEAVELLPHRIGLSCWCFLLLYFHPLELHFCSEDEFPFHHWKRSSTILLSEPTFFYGLGRFDVTNWGAQTLARGISSKPKMAKEGYGRSEESFGKKLLQLQNFLVEKPLLPSEGKVGLRGLVLTSCTVRGTRGDDC